MKGIKGRRIVSLLVAVCMLAGLLPMTAAAADVFGEIVTEYVDEDGILQLADAIPITKNTIALEDNWYIVNEDITIYERMKVTGTVYLILADGKTITASMGINVPENANLTIYGQSGQSGELYATSGINGAAGIGGSNGEANGPITITGGNVTATGYSNGAGIGGGNRGAGMDITIASGTVTANGGSSGAGIGGGLYGDSRGITITGGNVTANGGESGAGIGGGNTGDGMDITIEGGIVTATCGYGGAGIGGGSGGNGSGITIKGGIVTATGETNGAGIGGGRYGAGTNITIAGGTVTANGGANGAGIGGGWGGDGSGITIEGGFVEANGGDGGAGIGGGYLGASSSITFSGGVTIASDESVAIGGTPSFDPDYDHRTYGNTEKEACNIEVESTANPQSNWSSWKWVRIQPANLINTEYLDEDGAIQPAYAVPITEDTTTLENNWYVVNEDVTISERMDITDTVDLILADGMTLTAEKGIHVPEDASLTIYGQTEQSGELNATGDGNDAGIGGNYGEYNGKITITGGVVTANGGSSAAGIGGGVSGDGCGITITGGVVTANGGSSGAGIGGGYYGNGTDILIVGGTVTVKGGGHGAGIGGGYNGAGTDIEISGGKVTAIGSYDSYGGAGIGGGFNGDGMDITIYGGTIEVVGGENAAGIGSGCNADIGGSVVGSNITIYDGHIKVNGGYEGAGIGGGYKGDGTNITIEGGIVNATGGDGGAGIGGGRYGAGMNITISGEKVKDGVGLAIADNAQVEAAGGRNSTGIAAVAAAEEVDTARPVSLTLNYYYDSRTKFSNVQFSLYRVADISRDGTFTTTGAFTAYPMSFDDLDNEAWHNLAKMLSDIVARDQITALENARTDRKGVLTFSDKTPGLYLVIGAKHSSGGYTYTPAPFLISLPFLSKIDGWNYDVTYMPMFTRRRYGSAGGGGGIAVSEVTAIGGENAAGIGGGQDGDSSGITIEGGVTVVSSDSVAIGTTPDFSADYDHVTYGNTENAECDTVVESTAYPQSDWSIWKWVKIQPTDFYTVTLDYKTNGGTLMTSPDSQITLPEGETLYTADLGEGVKSGWSFVGWNVNPNAKAGLEEIEVNGNKTLYAIYKKEFTVTAAGEAIAATLYNNDKSVVITLPETPERDGWQPDGWRDETGAEFRTGLAQISGDTSFSPLYKKVITLVYDTNGSTGSISSQLAYMYENDEGATPASFELALHPQRIGYTFTGWALSKDPARIYKDGDRIELTEDEVAKAQWQKNPGPKPGQVTVTYNASANGGGITSAAAELYLDNGENVDLSSIKAEKKGYDFVGWNTDKDAHEALAGLAAEGDITLYAIFKKNITAVFHSGAEITDENSAIVTAALYNNDKSVEITAPEPAAISDTDWVFDGWRKDKHTIESEYIDSPITIYGNTKFYAIYLREIALNGERLSQCRNTGGGIESKVIVLGEPETAYNETTNERFVGWEVTVTDEDGNEETTLHDAGEQVFVSGMTTVKEKIVNIPDGATAPTVETVGAIVSSENVATLSETVTEDEVVGNEIFRQGFVYWDKLSGTKYTVIADDDTAVLSNLSPGTEYYYYAFAESAAGIGKGSTKRLVTMSTAAASAIMISPEYVSVEKGSERQLLARILPDSAKNSGVVWSSSNDKVAAVDQNGKVTGKSVGRAEITATTGRLSAKCIVDVTGVSVAVPMDFSEWHMVSHTSKYAKNGIGYDWDTANDGADHKVITAYLARWEGAVDEEKDPRPKNPPSSQYNDVNEVYHVQNVEWLPKRTSDTDNDEIKLALMKYGAVYSVMYIDEDKYLKGYNYYCPYEIDDGCHAVAIVGWDDNYPKTKFRNMPAGNGAFICKNSWGDKWGDDGYFYVSYYDKLLGRMSPNAVVTGIESDTAYNTIYQYDPLGAVKSKGFYETTYAANVFPVSNTVDDETLHAVSFYTYHKNTSYDVYVITDYNDSKSLSRIYTPSVSSASGIIENIGYHTVDLKKPVTLKSGTRFAVVVCFETPCEDAYVYYESPKKDNTSKASANEGESYFSSDGKDWQDLTKSVKDANFCIKAFTDNGRVGLFSAIDNAERRYENDKAYTLPEAMNVPIDEYEETGEDTVSLMDEESRNVFGGMLSTVYTGDNIVNLTDGYLFPTSFDLRKMGLLSPVKNQNDWPICWAYAAYASLESNVMRRQTTISFDTDLAFTLNRTDLTMSKGSAFTLETRISPANLPDKSVEWSSAKENVAIVDTNGTVRAVGPGSTIISAKLSPGGLVARCSVVVEDDDEIEEIIQFEEKRIYKEVGDVFTVKYSVTPEKSGSYYGWISDNENVATVNNGVITAKGAGTAQISILSGREIKDTVTIVVGDGFDLEIGSIDITNSTFDDGTLSGDVSINITNNSSSARPSLVILAAYDNETGAMAGMVSRNGLLASGENTIEFNDISFDKIAQEGCTLKCFVWNSLGNMYPLSEPKQKSIAAK
ncbi:MAG: InlB B-repeat-containing protein [Oscillospiraceae bacterium]|nr:InlB B-repeat-containing protein [Oscillospiraceae bacterium]